MAIPRLRKDSSELQRQSSRKKSSLRSMARIVVPLMKERGVVKAGIFGSYARGEQKEGSDLDILVQLKKGDGYFELVRLEQDLALALRTEVDLVTYGSLHPLLRNRILNEEVKII